MGEVAEPDENTFSIVDDAFERADLPSPCVEESPLGARALDLFVAGILQAAGITVEIVKGGAGAGDLYHVVQIVGEADIVAAFGVKEEENIKYVGKDDMLGLQVKLLDVATWKVTVINENKETHETKKLKRARACTGEPAKTTTFKTDSLYEIAVPVPGGRGICCTAALSKLITINIAFKRGNPIMFGHPQSAWLGDKPLIAQRRIDSCFINRHLLTCQVSVLF